VFLFAHREYSKGAAYYPARRKHKMLMIKIRQMAEKKIDVLVTGKFHPFSLECIQFINLLGPMVTKQIDESKQKHAFV
jgi:hypothetical protein